MLAFSGSFTGTGTAGKAITGVGFQPDVVLVKAGNDSNADTFMATKDMPVGSAVPLRSDQAKGTNYINSIDADGFTVGSAIQTNQSGYTIYFLALKADSANDFSTIAFVGDATDEKLVFTAWQPTYALLKTDAGITGVRKWAGMGSTIGSSSSSYLATPNYQGAGPRTDLVAFNSDGMRVSNGDSSGGNLVNQNGSYTYGFVIKNSANFAAGAYTGSGVDPTVRSTGFQPIWIDTHTNNGGNPVIQYQPQQAGGFTAAFDSAQSATYNYKNFTSTGYSNSGGNDVNANGTTYWWAAIGAKAATAVTSSNDTLMLMGV